MLGQGLPPRGSSHTFHEAIESMHSLRWRHTLALFNSECEKEEKSTLKFTKGVSTPAIFLSFISQTNVSFLSISNRKKQRSDGTHYWGGTSHRWTSSLEDSGDNQMENWGLRGKHHLQSMCPEVPWNRKSIFDFCSFRILFIFLFGLRLTQFKLKNTDTQKKTYVPSKATDHTKKAGRDQNRLRSSTWPPPK